VVNRTLSVFIPAYQEEGNIGDTVHELRTALDAQESLTYEIIIVNDGSTDRTAEIAEAMAKADPRIRVVHNPQNLGLARTWGVGALATRYEYIGWIPGDNAFPAESLKEWLAPLGRADLIQTYILNTEVRYLNRRFVSITYTKMMNLLFGLNLRYYNGIQICRRELLLGITTHSDGFALLSEMLVKLITQGTSYIQVGIRMQERLQGESKAVRLHNILDVLLTMLRLVLEVKFIYRKRYHSPGRRIAWPPAGD